MKEKKLTLKRSNSADKLSLSFLFADKKKRYLFMFLFILPFLIAIYIFARIAYREYSSIKTLASGGEVEIKDEFLISGPNYILRDNATDLQKEYFSQLKDAYENTEVIVDDLTKAELIAKNYIADFYTWTNKQGQFDIGGMYYIYDGEYVNGDHYKENVYLIARDGFYKYLGNYMTDYGVENLLEVTDVEIVKSEKLKEQYMINEHIANKQDESGEWYDYREDRYYDAYLINCRWTYNPETPLTLSNFANSTNLLIINKNGRFLIVAASDKAIEVNNKENENESESEESFSETEGETSNSSANG